MCLLTCVSQRSMYMCVNCVYGHISERESAFSCLCWLQLWKLACQKHCCLQGLYKIYSYAYWMQNTLVSHQCVFIVTYPFLNTYYLSIYLELHSGYLKAILDQRTLLTKYLLKCHVVTYFPSSMYFDNNNCTYTSFNQNINTLPRYILVNNNHCFSFQTHCVINAY